MKRTAVLMIAMATFVVVSGMALAADHAEQINACLNPNGLTFIVDDLAECGQNDVALTWNVEGPPGPEGPQGPEGPPGPEGGLTCGDEIRINEAAPAFEVRPECGLVTVATGLGEDGSFSSTGSNFVESAPFGNPPGDHDVAYRFEVLSDTTVSLEYLDLAIETTTGGSGPLDVFLVGEKPSTNLNLSSEPDMANVLEQWELTVTELTISGGRLISVTGPELLAHDRYWVVLSVTEPSSRYRWWVGIQPEMPGGAKAERYDFVVGPHPPGAWIGSDLSGGSAGLRVVGLPQS